MDNRIVAQSFLRASPDMLAAQLALLDQTTLGKLLKSKATDLFSQDKGEFNRIVDKSARGLLSEQPGELVLRLLGALNGILAIAPRRYAVARDLEDNCDEILSSCLAVLRETELDFTGTDLQDMLRFLMNKMFGEIGKRFESLGDDKQQEVVDAVRKFIDDLPEAQREKLRNEAGSDEITDSYIRKAIISGTLSSAFAAAVSVAGFAFYTGAVSLLATLAGLVGLTLPFSFYIGLTSSIAVIANPFFVLPVLAGGGWWFYSRQNDKMRRRIAPLVVAQFVLTHLAGRSDSLDHSDQALKLWQGAWVVVERARAKHAQTAATLAATREELQHTKSQIRARNEQRAQSGRDQEAIQFQVKARCAGSAADIASSTWGSHLGEAGLSLKSCQDAVETSRNRCVKSGISGLFEWTGRAMEIWVTEQRADSAACAASSIVIESGDGAASMYPSDIKEFVHRHAVGQMRRQELDAELADTQRKEGALEQQAADEQQFLRTCQAERGHAEARYWGLSELR